MCHSYNWIARSCNLDQTKCDYFLSNHLTISFRQFFMSLEMKKIGYTSWLFWMYMFAHLLDAAYFNEFCHIKSHLQLYNNNPFCYVKLIKMNRYKHHLTLKTELQRYTLSLFHNTRYKTHLFCYMLLFMHERLSCVFWVYSAINTA